jgi:hypothetical protein
MFSALPLKPDIAEYGRHVRLVPPADVKCEAKSVCVPSSKTKPDFVERYPSWLGCPNLALSDGHSLCQSAGADNLASRKRWINRIARQQFN